VSQAGYGPGNKSCQVEGNREVKSDRSQTGCEQCLRCRRMRLHTFDFLAISDSRSTSCKSDHYEIIKQTGSAFSSLHFL